MKQKRDRIKRRNEAKVEEDDDHPKYLSDQELEKMGVLNWSSRRINNKDMDNMKYYDEIPKRKILYDGGGTEFITNLADDIVCLTSFLTGHLILILGRAIELKDDSTYRMVHGWTREQHKFLYLKLNEDNEVVSFSVLHKVDFDPLKKQKNPFVLDYIYTCPKHRKLGYATSLLNHIKHEFECSAFCNNTISCELFRKCGFIFTGNWNRLPMFRFPF